MKGTIMDGDFSAIRIVVADGVAHVTLDNPPVNVLNVQLMTELRRFLTAMRVEDTVKVIVFDSANPDFFIAHVDMTLIDEPKAFDALAKDVPEGLNVFQAFSEMLRYQPQVTIVKLKGLARGGGAEFVAAADMCFAEIGRAGLAQCEALMGIIPGGAATQYLGHRLGRNRLGADLFDAETAERYGWINRALPADQIDTFVETLAKNIAALPEGVIEATKKVLPPADLRAGLATENQAWADLFIRPAAEQLIRGGLRDGAQTREGEKRLEALLRATNLNRLR